MGNYEKVMLTVSIATYNRCQYLKELVETVLSIDRTDIDVVVTDNVSTDGTMEMLQSIKDPRLKICRHSQAVPAFVNIIESIFNGDGKYVLYCNDRDLLFPEQIERLIELLYKDEYSFIMLERQRLEKGGRNSTNKNTYDLTVYAKGAESLLAYKYGNHPTGMVYDRELMGEHLCKEKYFAYQDVCFTWDFLMRDLVQFEKSARYDCGAWTERPKEFKRINRAGTFKEGQKLYFYPSFIQKYTQTVLKSMEPYSMSDQERQTVYMNVLVKMIRDLMSYKVIMGDRYETAHYGIKMRFVTTPEMIGHYVDCYKSDLAFLEKEDQLSAVVESWKRYCLRGGVEFVLRSIKCDIVLAVRWLRYVFYEKSTESN